MLYGLDTLIRNYPEELISIVNYEHFRFAMGISYPIPNENNEIEINSTKEIIARTQVIMQRLFEYFWLGYIANLIFVKSKN